MKIPRNLDADVLINKLVVFGYKITRKTGSHIRITTYLGGKHSETIPFQKPLKVGTLNTILKNISAHHKLTKHELMKKLKL
jgi:predicted RNA binding protein YcfA (HicA-like mRNA interferase family)